MTREALLSFLGAGLLRLLFFTIRLRVTDRIGLAESRPAGPVILCFWHNRILGVTLSFVRRYPRAKRGGVTVLTSPSRDGEILARFVARFGMGAVRGSSSRRGSRALREMLRLVSQGGDIAITPDGPRGPRYRLGPGALLLAQNTGAPIVPIHASFSRCFRMKTWDGFIIPLPFSTVSITVDDMISVPRQTTDEKFEILRLRIETILRHGAD